MRDTPWRIARAAAIDEEGLVASPDRSVAWSDFGGEPPASPRAARDLIAAPWSGFRRLDLASFSLALAVESLGVGLGLSPERRQSTAVVLATAAGCLDCDWRYEQSRSSPLGPSPRWFAYTLPSTCIGDLAIRHGLTGPSLCLSVAPGCESEAFAEAAALLAAGDASAALVCLGDWLTPEVARAVGLAPRRAFLVALLERAAPHVDDPFSLEELAGGGRSLSATIASLRARVTRRTVS